MTIKKLFKLLKYVKSPLVMKYYIAVKKLNGIVIESSDHANDRLALSINADMMQLGYLMSEDLFNAVKSLSEADAKECIIICCKLLRYSVGSDVVYKPMYPNFPDQVIDASHEELYLNAINHYWSYGEWKPDYHKTERPVHYEHIKFKMLDRLLPEDFAGIFKRILASNESMII